LVPRYGGPAIQFAGPYFKYFGAGCELKHIGKLIVTGKQLNAIILKRKK
jgi:hypothetical protein